MELISIIVPVYNMEKYLERCVNSVIAQTYGNIEIILVDDGSTDNSPAMCDAYARKDARVRVVHKSNGGLSDARNAGLAVAEGSYIGYVDSDDWIEPDMYEKMYHACADNGAPLAICRYACEAASDECKAADRAKIAKEYGDNGDNGDECSDEGSDVVLLSRDELLKIYIGGHDRYIIYNSAWSKLYRRDLVDGMLFPKGRNSEDIMYTTRAFCRLNRAAYIDKPLYHYVLDRKDSIMNVSKGERMFRDEIPFWREHIACIRDMVSDEMADLAAYHFWRRLLFYYIDMKKAGGENEKYARKLIDEIKSDRAEIDRVYKGGIVSKGDMARMRLFRLSPQAYATTVRLYDSVIIPLRQGIKKRGSIEKGF